jgi:hypothetical protein
VTEELWSDFWKLFERKGATVRRIGMAFFLERIATIAQEPDEIARTLSAVESADLQDRKLRALYVDLVAGVLTTPEQVVADRESSQMSRALAKSVTIFAIIVESDLRALGEGAEQAPAAAAPLPPDA